MVQNGSNSTETVQPRARLSAGVIAFAQGRPALGVVIWIIVLVNAGFSFWREHRAEQAVQALKQLLPAYARVMRDGDFGHARAGPAGVNRNEAMHLAIQLDVFQHFTAVGLERTAVIMQFHATDFRDQSVRQFRGQCAGDESVPTIFAPARDNVVSLIEFRQQTFWERERA